jgi:mannosyltransferase OCH1-like enzyme
MADVVHQQITAKMKCQRRNALFGLVVVAICLIAAWTALLTADVTGRATITHASAMPAADVIERETIAHASPVKMADVIGRETTHATMPTADVMGRETIAPASRVTIPNVVHMIWKTHELPAAARGLAEEWVREEPHYTYKITDDAECEALTHEFPTLRPRYANLKMNVMKADICRLLVIYKYGGIYRDLDVQHVKPLREWFNHSLPVVYGYEDEHLCQWFFAAHAGNACIRKVIDHVTEAIANVSLDFNAYPELVIDSTGPGAFTQGMKGCPTPPTLTVADLTTEKVRHQFAAMNWRNGYTSWLVERQKMAGWVDILDHRKNAFVKDYFMPTQDALLAPYGQEPEVAVTVEQSSHRFGELLRYYPAAHAVDRNLDSFVMTENGPNQWWQLNVADAVRVTCVRVWSKRRLHDLEFFRENTLTLYDSDGRSVFVSAPFGSSDSSVSIRVPDTARTVPIVKLRLARSDGAVLFSEIEIFSDNDCRVARRLALPRDQQAEASPTKEEGLIRALRANTYHCKKQRAVSWESWMEYSLCLDAPLPTPCSVVSVTHRVSPNFASLALTNLSCSFHAAASQLSPPREADSPPFTTPHLIRPSGASPADKSMTLNELIADVNTPAAHSKKDGAELTSTPQQRLRSITVLHLDVGKHTWSFIDDVILLGKAGQVDHLLMELCVQTLEHDEGRMTSAMVNHHLLALRRLHEVFVPYAWHVTPRSPLVGNDRFGFPSCTQVSLLRRSLAEL